MTRALNIVVGVALCFCLGIADMDGSPKEKGTALLIPSTLRCEARINPLGLDVRGTEIELDS